MIEQTSVQIQQLLIDLHNSSWTTQQGIQIMETIKDKKILKHKISALADRIFEGIQGNGQDFISLIYQDNDNEDWISFSAKSSIRFSFSTFQFEIMEIPQDKNREDKIQDQSIQTNQARQNKGIQSLCRFLQILDLVLDGLNNDRFRSKREVYYLYQDLFVQQSTVDRMLKRLSFLLQVPRRSLQFVSATKGLCAGAILLKNTKDGMELDVGQFSRSGKGLNVSEFMDQWDQTIVYGDFILVVEKETMYFRILDEGQEQFLSIILIKTLQDKCALLTGKGYPCLSTQGFLKLLAQSNPTKPVYYLGDLDPHGLDILCQYTFGNIDSMFERNNVPWVRWLGGSISISSECKGSELQPREKLMFQNMIQRDYFNPSHLLTSGVQYVYAQLWVQWLQQMQNIMNLNLKFELETLIPKDQTLTEVCVNCIINFECNYEKLLQNLCY